MCQPTPTPTPTPDPTLCTTQWPKTTINTIGKGDPPANNQFLRHEITGHIIDPGSLTPKAHRIHVCAGTFVRSVIIFFGGGTCAMNTAGGSLDCETDCNVCEGTVNATEKYKSVSPGSGDTDRMQIIPQ